MNNLRIGLILILLLSCKTNTNLKNKDNTKKNDLITKTDTVSTRKNTVASKVEQPNLSLIEKDTIVYDFFNDKYTRQYGLNIDGSNFSDHPIFSYLDCDKEGYFTVHYIPKRKQMINFWKEEYFKKYKYEYDNIEKEDSIIKKILKNVDYNIFSYRIKKGYLCCKDRCTFEAIYPHKNSKGLIYFFNQNKKQWSVIDTINVKTLPPYLDNAFFLDNYKSYFK